MNRNRFERQLVFFFAITLLCACSTLPAPRVGLTILRQQVSDTERAFARTMAVRDHAAFAQFLSEDAIFLSGDSSLRGKPEVAAGWKSFFEGATAPFSWQPDTVEVLASGALALSSGPVLGPDGSVIARFSSIWRQEAPGVWKIVFDKGNPVCDGRSP